MAKKRGYKKKLKDEKKQNSKQPLPKGGAKKKSRGKEKDKRADRRKPSDVKRSVKSGNKRDPRSRIQDPRLKKVSGIRKRELGQKGRKGQKGQEGKKGKSTSQKGRIHDFRGRFVEKQYQDRLRRLRKELIRDGIVIDGKKVTKFTSYSTITKAIYNNKLFSLAESHNVSYFDVLGKIVTEVNALKEKQEIFVKIKPFFKDFRVFNIKHKPVDSTMKITSYYSQAVSLNPQLVAIVEHQKDLIQRVIDEFPRQITSPLFKIKEKRFENPLTGSTYALEYDYNDIIPSGMSISEFINFLKAIMGDEYKQIAFLRMKSNLDRFDDEE